jgi:hypothetical protein
LDICQIIEQPFSDPQPKITRSLPRKSYCSNPTDRDGRLSAQGRQHLDQTIHKNRRLAGPRAGVDKHVPMVLRDGSVTLRLVGSGPTYPSH